jgi:DNA polymerase III gamma/tau subunit
MNYLEKIKIYNDKVDLQLANKLCTNIDFNDFSKYLNYINTNSIQNAIDVLYVLHNKGYSVMDILDEFFSYLKLTDLLTNDMKYKIIPYVCKYIHIFHDLHEDEIELSLFTNNLYKLIHNL